MQDMDRVYAALRKAYAEGNTEAAKKLATYIKSVSLHEDEEDSLPVTETKSGTAGPIEAIKGSTKRMLSSSQTAIEAPFGDTQAALRGMERGENITERPGASLEAVKQAYADEGILGAAGEAISQIPGAISEQLPFIASMAGGYKTGFALTPPVLPFVGPLAKPIGGFVGAAATPLLMAYGSNMERQVAEQQAAGQPVDVSSTRALGAAGPQAALDVVSLRLGLGRLLGVGPKDMGTEAAEALARESLLTAVTKGSAKTALAEMPTEVTQQMLERAQALLPLTNDEALAEYAEAAYAAGIMSPLGGATRLYERREARQLEGQLDKERGDDGLTEEERRAQEEVRIEAGLPPTIREVEDGQGDIEPDTEAAGESVPVPSQPGETTPAGGITQPVSESVDGTRDTTVGAGEPAGTSDGALTTFEQIDALTPEQKEALRLRIEQYEQENQLSSGHAALILDPAQRQQNRQYADRVLDVISKSRLDDNLPILTAPTQTAFNEAELAEQKTLEEFATGEQKKPKTKKAKAAKTALEVVENPKPEELTAAPVGTKFKVGDKIYEKTINGFEEVAPTTPTTTQASTQAKPVKTAEEMQLLAELAQRDVRNREAAARQQAEQEAFAAAEPQRAAEMERRERERLAGQPKVVAPEVATEDQIERSPEAEAIASGEISRIDAENAQTKLQEKSALNLAQKEMTVDKLIEENTANQGKTLANTETTQPIWRRVLETLIPEPKTVPGQARAMTATTAVAQKIRDVMDRVGGDVNIVYGRLNTSDALLKNADLQTDKPTKKGVVRKDSEGASDTGYAYSLRNVGKDNVKVAQFDPATNTITIDKEAVAFADKSLTATTLHEMVHYMLDHVVDNKKKLSPAQIAALNKLENIYKNLLDVQSTITDEKFRDAYDIPTLKEFLAEVLTNDGLKRDMAAIKMDKPEPKAPAARKKLYAYITSIDPDAKGESLLSAFVRRIAELLGLHKDPKVLRNVLKEIESILDDQAYIAPTETMRGKEVSYASGSTTVDVNDIPALEEAEEKRMPKGRQGFLSRFINQYFSLNRAWQVVRDLQNDRYLAKKRQKAMKAANKLIAGGEDINNFYTQMSLAFGQMQNFFNGYVMSPAAQLSKAIEDFAKTMGGDLKTMTKKATAKAGLYMTAQHESERRIELYNRIVPVNELLGYTYVDSAGKTFNSPNKSAAERRMEIFKALDSKRLPKASAQELKQELFYLVANYTKPGGASIDGVGGSKLPTDITSNRYNVSHLSYNDAKMLREHLNKPENAEMKKHIDNIYEKVAVLNQVARELNKKAGFWTDQVDNYVDFYGFEHYIPLKGKRDETDVRKEYIQSDPDSITTSRELKQSVGGIEGRQTPSENPILQSLAEATGASARAGRGVDYTKSIFNAVKQGHIKGDADLGKLSFEQRRNMTEEFKEDLDKRNVLLHYNEDGSVDMFTVSEPEMLEAIRRPLRANTNVIFEELNKITSFLGQMHTRYNPSFPVLNFTRDVLTNSFMMIAEGDPKIAAQYATEAAQNIFRMKSTINIMRGYHKGGDPKFLENELKKAKDKGDVFLQNLLEYMSVGGRTAYAQGFSISNAITDLSAQVGRSRILKTGDSVQKVFDVWTDSFELTARAAAYGLMKAKFIQENMSEQAAMVEAAAHVKQYANFEEVGRYGKEAGAMFMYFRQAMTGAVRAIEAIGPALVSWEKAERNLDPVIYGQYVAGKLQGTAEEKAEFMQRRELAEAEHNRHRKAAFTAITSLTALGAGVYMMAAMLAGDDDEGRNKVFSDDISRWTRFARFDLGGEDMFQMPWGFGLGAFPALGVQIAALGNQYNADPVKSLGNVFEIILDNFLPLPVSRINPFDNFTAWAADTLSPSVIRPAYEFAMNVNSFGQPIYNNRQTRVVEAYIGGDNIPQMYKDAAKFLYDTFGLDFSPNSMYFFTNNYADAVGRFAHNGYGLVLGLTGEKNMDLPKETMLFASFFSKRSNIDTRQYADLSKEMDSLRQKLNTLSERNPDAYYEYLDEHPYAPAMLKIYDKQTGGILNKLRKQGNDIRYNMPDLSLKEKEDMLNENKILQNIIKKSIVDNIEMFKEMDRD